MSFWFIFGFGLYNNYSKESNIFKGCEHWAVLDKFANAAIFETTNFANTPVP